MLRRSRTRLAPSTLFAALLAATPAAASDQPGQAPLKKLSLEELAEIDITSVSRRAQPLSTAAAAIVVISGDDIRRSGAGSLAEALRLAPGLHVARSDGRTWAISARGFNITTANKLLVLVDGRSVYSPLFGGMFWDVQDLDLADVDRIEVVRGPGGTLWGANAVNGIINIVTKPPRLTQGGLVTVGAGTEDRAIASARYGGGLGGRGFYRVYSKYSYRESQAFTTGADARDPLRRGQAGARAEWTLSSRSRLNVQGDVYLGRIGSFDRPNTDVSGGNALARWTYAFAPGRDLEVQAYYDRTNRTVPLQFDEHRDTFDLEVEQHVRLAGRHDVLIGADYRHSRATDVGNVAFSFVPPDHTTRILGVFVQDEIALAPGRVAAILGSKVETNEYTGVELSPTARVRWTPDNRQTIWGAVSRAVRLPTRLDRDLVFHSGPVITLRGDPESRSESVVAFEAGYRVRAGTRALVDVAAYVNRYDDLRSQELRPTGLPIVLANTLNAATAGVEIASTLSLAPWWRVQPAYSWFRKRFSKDSGSFDISGGVSEGNDPRHLFRLHSFLDLPRGLELDAFLRAVGELPDPRVPAYAELDLRFGWRSARGLEVSIVGDDLLHRRHAEFFGGAPREEFERGISGRLRWPF